MRSRIRVLIAEDQPALREALEDMIVADPALEFVGAAADAREAVEHATRLQPDVALLDVRMPFGGGSAASREISRVSPTTRVIALSAYDDRATVLEMLEAGAMSYVVKGADPTEITAAIKSAVSGIGTLSQQITGVVVDEVAARLGHDARLRRSLEDQVTRIREAITGEQLAMVFQPIVNVRSRAVAGLEALARFGEDPIQGPAEWFADAEMVGARVALEVEAVHRAVAAFGSNSAGFLAVNASPETIISGQLVDVAKRVDGRLVVELSEHALVTDYGALTAGIDALRVHGTRLAIDNAGAGFASLRHILTLAPEIIKLDISLTQGMASDRPTRAVALALLGFAAQMDAMVIAEGVENQEQLVMLQELGVQYAQGYFLGRPEPIHN